MIGSLDTGDHFGFESHEIDAFRAGAFVAVLLAGPGGDAIELSPTTGDATIREV